ncbi:hypothetical protein CI109_106023 [Kwoniella shandongensis]|uniref:Uncharacterized protein n=1 Tax=Kwoniella shandongensis TaxID=1734106 RepID=A0A5M6C364_9TREE|nr:uncharacterized protein CI109_003928 [Kwoniella shandongensis]KAA5527669.1 hypothetical protein CI109_003928 [Kwoniella shandongensis]
MASTLRLLPSTTCRRLLPSYLPRPLVHPFRGMTTSAISRQSQPQTQSDPSNGGSAKDPSHPYLHYHPTSTHTVLSFLPRPPVGRSRTALGYLPLGDAGLDDFREEPAFKEILDQAIKSGLEQGKSQSVTFEAETRPGDGWIHITDERAIPPAGRIGETEDLIGSVYVQDGKIVASTYSPLPTYRLVTTNGVLTLPRGLDQHLVEVLEAIDAEERGEKSL